MSSTQIREPANFGKRTEPHTIVISRNGKSKIFKVKPIFFSIAMCFGFMLMFGYFGATAYLIFRDDLIASSFARQARVQHEYEDRIAALRSKLDRVTSRQLLDQQQIEARVEELMNRQASIGKRSSRMGDLLDKARRRGLGVIKSSNTIPVPSVNPQKNAKAVDTITTGSIDVSKKISPNQLASAFAIRGVPNFITPKDKQTSQVPPKLSSTILAYNKPQLSTDFTKEIFGNVAEAIGVIDASQREEIDGLRLAAATKTQKIASILKSVGAKVPDNTGSDIGGPFVPLDHSVDFEVHLHALEDTLKHYDQVTGLANALPLKSPVSGAKISSRYGSRVDPFNGRSAMHSGIDFKAKTGTPVKSTGRGVVVKAGRKGGYGKVVEVKHLNGLTTRYAHLSRINVKAGERVKAGQIVGKVGAQAEALVLICIMKCANVAAHSTLQFT